MGLSTFHQLDPRETASLDLGTPTMPAIESDERLESPQWELVKKQVKLHVTEETIQEGTIRFNFNTSYGQELSLQAVKKESSLGDQVVWDVRVSSTNIDDPRGELIQRNFAMRNEEKAKLVMRFQTALLAWIQGLFIGSPRPKKSKVIH